LDERHKLLGRKATFLDFATVNHDRPSTQASPKQGDAMRDFFYIVFGSIFDSFPGLPANRMNSPLPFVLNCSVESWRWLWSELGCEKPQARIHDQLKQAYSEPHRHYHTLAHLSECFAELGKARMLCNRLSEVAVALWFHDAIYDPTQRDNEIQSACWAEQTILDHGLSQSLSERIRDLILATRHQEVHKEPDAQVLSDVDLAILGAPSERFEEYERQIRREYFWMPESEFNQGRHRILTALVSRDFIYCTPHFRKQLEEQARSNLKGSLSGLERGWMMG
jgi:predicted metal-dependent HD superfamily phosphohydrolase